VNIDPVTTLMSSLLMGAYIGDGVDGLDMLSLLMGAYIGDDVDELDKDRQTWLEEERKVVVWS
jgi:hypothetical protein